LELVEARKELIGFLSKTLSQTSFSDSTTFVKPSKLIFVNRKRSQIYSSVTDFIRKGQEISDFFEQELKGYEKEIQETIRQQLTILKEEKASKKFSRRAVMIACGAAIPPVMATAIIVPVMVLQKHEKPATVPADIIPSYKVEKDAYGAESPSDKKSDSIVKSAPPPGAVGRPSRESTPHPAPESRDQGWALGPHGPYRTQEGRATAGAVSKPESTVMVPPAGATGSTEGHSSGEGQWGYVKKKRWVEAGKWERVWIPERREGNRRIEGHYEQRWVPGGYWEEYMERVWIPKMTAEKRLIDGRWHVKRHVEDPPGSGRYKTVWVPE
jgi:hypothetical protein